MNTVNIYEAKTNLSKLLERVAQGEEIIIAKAGKPIARLAPLQVQAIQQRIPGLLKGKIIMAPDFENTPQEVLDSFNDSFIPGEEAWAVPPAKVGRVAEPPPPFNS